MAIQRNPLDEDQRNQGTSTQSGLIGGSSNTSGGPAAGTGWTNLNQYLDTNAGSGEKIAGEAVKDTEQGLAAGSSAIQDWSKGLQQNIADTKQADTSMASGYKNQIQNQASTFNDPNQKQSFDEWKKITEQKPKGFEEQSGYQKAYSEQGKIRDTISSFGDTAANQKRVADTFRKQSPTYSTGMANLDTFLATADGGGSLQGKLQNIGQKYGQDYIGQAGSAYNAGVADLTDTMGRNRAEVGDVIGNVANSLRQRGEQGVAGLNAQNEAARKALTIELMNRGENITGQSNATLADALSPEELANLEALYALEGKSFDGSQKNKTFSAGVQGGREVASPYVAPELAGENPEDYIGPGSPGKSLGTSIKRAGTDVSNVIKRGANYLKKPEGKRFIL